MEKGAKKKCPRCNIDYIDECPFCKYPSTDLQEYAEILRKDNEDSKQKLFEFQGHVLKLEKEHNELKLKEQIAHDAKETAQEAHQEAQKNGNYYYKEYTKIFKELQALKDDIEIKLDQLETKGSKTFWSQEYFELEKYLKELIK